MGRRTVRDVSRAKNDSFRGVGRTDVGGPEEDTNEIDGVKIVTMCTGCSSRLSVSVSRFYKHLFLHSVPAFVPRSVAH